MACTLVVGLCSAFGVNVVTALGGAMSVGIARLLASLGYLNVAVGVTFATTVTVGVEDRVSECLGGSLPRFRVRSNDSYPVHTRAVLAPNVSQ